MRLKDAKTTYGVSSTYYYKLKAKAGDNADELEKLLKEFKARKNKKSNNTKTDVADNK